MNEKNVIVELKVENVKRIEVADITPEMMKDPLITVGGNNGAGKSSLLDAIEYALGGTRNICEEPLRRGSKKGHTLIKLANGLRIIRSFTKKGSQLKVFDADDNPVSSPQAILNKLCGDLMFDPLAFTNMDKKPQADLLLKLTGINFSDIEAQHEKDFDERRHLKYDASDLKARLIDFGDEEIPDKEESLADINAKYEAAKASNESKSNASRTASNAENKRLIAENKVNELTQALYEAEQDLEAARMHKKEAEQAEELNVDTVDLSVISERHKNLSERNERVREKQADTRNRSTLKALNKDIDALTQAIDSVPEKKAELISKTKLPIEGLGFDSEGVTFGGLPFNQASGAQQLRVSAAIGFAMNPDLCIMLIRDGSLLDEKSLALLGELAAEADGKVFVERVGEGKDCSVVIEEGKIKEIAQ